MRHAYLIMAHKNWNQLKKLIALLDDRRNDIFLHIDLKHKPPVPIIKDIISVPQKSKIKMVRSITVNWGGYTVIEAELILLEAAMESGCYDYYHLISGQDLPIKTQDDVHEFFSRHTGSEFVGFGQKEWIENVRFRCDYYWFFQEYSGRDNRIMQKLDSLSISLQKRIRVNRLNKRIFSAGPNWFSITNGFARYIVSQHARIREQFSYTKCADECFLQILAMESGFKSNCFWPADRKDINAIMRAIDWDRGSPYTYRAEDYNELINSKYLFARKFDEDTDNEIIDNIYNYLTAQ